MIMVMAYHFVMLVAQPECHTVGAGAWWTGGGVRTKNMVDVRCVLKGGNCPLNAYVEQRKS